MHISPLFQFFYKSPYIGKIYDFLLFTFFCFPYFDHDAFMHHALHALEAPELNDCKQGAVTTTCEVINYH